MSQTVQRFNLDTMSGVFPGTRTKVYQRVRLTPAVTVPADAPPVTRWARLLWYEDPPSCVIELEAQGGEGTTSASSAQVLARIVEIDAASLAQRLAESLATAGWQPVICGVCAFWRPLAARTSDGLLTGSCRWRADTGSPLAGTLHSQLGAQSMLSLGCTHWQGAQTQPPAPLHPIEEESPGAITPMPRRAELESDDRWTLVGQVRRWMRKPAAQSLPAPTWEDRLVERSGVGAGTEPCFVCQGRIANLGALAVATPEGDKQTFSVWRCRVCYTYYLNDWIDRWERTDSLETEERYYRLSPAEALEVLAVIDDVVHAEHPARRHERTAQRDWMLAFLGDRPPLSHQVRQGR